MILLGAATQVLLPARAPWPAAPMAIQRWTHSWSVMQPYACLPSMHVTLTAYPCCVALSVLRTRWVKTLSVVGALLIAISTLTLKEHYVLDTLAGFQLCPAYGLPNPPFDGPFWRRELAVFERFARPDGHRDGPTVSGFLDELARRLATHPSRLVHRDFHVNNLFWHAGGVWAVDFQDMRYGPDTYDAVSLLRERAGVYLTGDPARWLETAARRLGWPDGWRDRFLECAAQRGLKVVGTFLRLKAEGRGRYSAWVADVARQAEAALRSLASPPAVVEALRRAASDAGV